MAVAMEIGSSRRCRALGVVALAAFAAAGCKKEEASPSGGAPAGGSAPVAAAPAPSDGKDSELSVAREVGAGWFGGMLPLLATAIVASTGNIYNGLWYPIAVAVMTTVVGGLFLRDTRGIDIKVGSGVEAAQHA